jgi:hypothetical protein
VQAVLVVEGMEKQAFNYAALCFFPVFLHNLQYSPFTREAHNGDITEAQQIQSGLGENAEIKKTHEVN